MGTMASALQRKLVVVTGKGGVGKTTVAAALGLAAARRGLRTIVVELGDQRRLPALFERAGQRAAAEVALDENLWSITIDPDLALLEWLQKLGGRLPGRLLAGSGTFQYFAAAAPGAKELVSMVKVWELTQAERWHRRARRYDLVVLDGPATGHALGLLRSPHTFGAIARVGPVFGQAEKIRELLEDADRTSYVGVTHPTEMAVGELLDLAAGLRSSLGCELHAAIANATLPRRFNANELERIARLDGASPLRRSAMAAARAVHERARAQQNQIARLRRRGLNVLSVPFVFTAELDSPAIGSIGEQLARRL
jgi:anion-transporting  ArsA/GET3 family ATPase